MLGAFLRWEPMGQVCGFAAALSDRSRPHPLARIEVSPSVMVGAGVLAPIVATDPYGAPVLRRSLNRLPIAHVLILACVQHAPNNSFKPTPLRGSRPYKALPIVSIRMGMPNFIPPIPLCTFPASCHSFPSRLPTAPAHKHHPA